MQQAEVPITELNNELCTRLDGALPADEFLRTLGAADGQIFSGYKGYPGIMSGLVVAAVERAGDAAGAALKRGAPVVMTGCGTSGRLAFLTARRYRSEEAPPQSDAAELLRYAMAGGDSALLLSDELPEDDPAAGRADVDTACEGLSKAAADDRFVIGVTCGLSAPYVAGQLANEVTAATGAKNPADARCAVIGFNPLSLARNAAIANVWPAGAEEASFRELLVSVEPSVAVVNPVVGPEPIGGSSRMKGGTATLVLLDIIVARALRAASSDSSGPAQAPTTLEALAGFQCIQSLAYATFASTLPAVMQRAAAAVRAGSRLLYLGAGRAGCLGFIDLSEMPDTYGGPFDQTRAFVCGGWGDAGVRNQRGDLSGKSHLHRIDVATDFMRDIVPTITAADCVVVLALDGDELTTTHRSQLVAAAAAAAERGATVDLIAVGHGAGLADALKPAMDGRVPCMIAAVSPGIPNTAAGADLALKIALNAVSTYAQAAGRGALFRGVMIAAGPANDKIYARCVRMIADTVGVSARDAEIALVRSIYATDDVAEVVAAKLDALPRARHIEAALLPEAERHKAQLVLPIAFLLAIPKGNSSTSPGAVCGCWSYSRAHAAMSANPQLSSVLEEALAEARTTTTTTRSAAPVPPAHAPKTAAAAAAVLAIDLGGTNVRAAVVDSTGRVVGEIHREVVGSDDRSPARVMRLVEAVACAAMAPGVTAAAVGVPGHIDDSGSVGQMANYAGWGDARIPVQERLQTVLGPHVRVVVVPDAACSLAAEVLFGAGRLAGTVAAITVGTGVGSGLALQHGAVIHTGHRGLVELGHSIVDTSADAAQCNCGQRGCVEATASGPAIAAAAGTADAEAALEGASSGDARCEAAVARAAEHLGVCAITATRAYDPELILVSGALGAALLPRVRAAYRARSWGIHPDATHVPLVPAACVEPGVIGAAAMAFREVVGDAATAAMRRFRLRRSAGAGDLAALYNVCLKTGDAGADGSHLFTDRELLGSIFVGPYVMHAPDFAFSLIDTEPGNPAEAGFAGVCGYTLGVLDTNAFLDECEAAWWPPLRQKYAAGTTGGLNDGERELVATYIAPGRSERPATDAELFDRWPSHMHIDLLPHVQGRGVGVAMVHRLLGALATAGSRGVHLTMAASNARAFRFYERLGFRKYREAGDDWVLVKDL